VVTVAPDAADDVLDRARVLGLKMRIVGTVERTEIKLPGETPLALSDLRTAHESWFPAYMDSSAA
jgi:hypothetical protein